MIKIFKFIEKSKGQKIQQAIKNEKRAIVEYRDLIKQIPEYKENFEHIMNEEKEHLAELEKLVK